MPKNFNYYKYYAPYDVEQLNQFITQVKDLGEKSGEYCLPEKQNKPLLTDEMMATCAAALADTASRSGVWCQNVNQNGAANCSSIYPEQKKRLENPDQIGLDRQQGQRRGLGFGWYKPMNTRAANSRKNER